MKPLFAFLFAVSLASETSTAATFFGPTPYRQRSDSPFYPGIQTGSIFVEDFEDGALNTPYVSVTGGSVGRVVASQGVDEDDGRLDGLGLNWVCSCGSPGLGAPFNIEIRFSPNPEGLYPRYAGFALLGFNYEFSIFDVTQYYQFFAPDGTSLSPGILESLVPRLPDETPSVSSGGDRFVGAYSEQGIGRILIGNINRFDHLQYGYSIPEPSALALLGGVMTLLVQRRRRRMVN